MASLPTPGGDTDTWGDELNEWALVGHEATGANKAHASSHQSGGADPIKLDDLAAPDDNTDLDASTSKHGLLKKLPGGTSTFLRADGTFAAAGGSVAADTLFDAKGDLAVGTGADTAAKLTVGANDTVPVAASGQTTGIIWQQIGNAQVASGAAIAGSKLNFAWADASDVAKGTSMPGSPATNDLVYRTDLQLLFFFDGTRWLTVQKFISPLAVITSSSSSSFAQGHVMYTDLDMWIEAVVFAATLGATNTGTSYWSGQLNKYDAASAGTAVGSAFTTAADSPSTTVNRRATIGAAIGGSATYKRMIVVWTKVVSPTNLDCSAALEYRLIGT